MIDQSINQSIKQSIKECLINQSIKRTIVGWNVLGILQAVFIWRKKMLLRLRASRWLFESLCGENRREGIIEWCGALCSDSWQLCWRMRHLDRNQVTWPTTNESVDCAAKYRRNHLLMEKSTAMRSNGQPKPEEFVRKRPRGIVLGGRKILIAAVKLSFFCGTPMPIGGSPQDVSCVGAKKVRELYVVCTDYCINLV